MPNSTTIAETVTAGSGPADATGSAAGGIGNIKDDVGSAEGGIRDSVQNSGPHRLAGYPDPKDDQGAQETWAEPTEPRLIPKIFPVYAFI